MLMLPVVFNWRDVEIIDGDGVATRLKAMVPQARYSLVCRRQFHDGEEYPLVVLEARTRASHNHYFAAIQEGWDNLPEGIAPRWPSSEHLRKWCLIEAGWFEEKEFDMDTVEHAQALGLFIRTEDDFARIHIRGTTVIVRRAKSQSAKAMGKAAFEDSKKAVLDLIASFVGVTRGALKRQAGRSG